MDRGVHAVVKALALFPYDSCCCFVGFILRLTHSGFLFSHLQITKPRMGADEFLWQASWRTEHLSVPEISEKPLLVSSWCDPFHQKQQSKGWWGWGYPQGNVSECSWWERVSGLQKQLTVFIVPWTGEVTSHTHMTHRF